MSSFEFIELCEYMPDEGRYKTELRGGDPDPRTAALMQVANEISVLRASYVEGADTDLYGPILYVAPTRLKAQQQEAELAADARESIYAMADLSRIRAMMGGEADAEAPMPALDDDLDDAEIDRMEAATWR